MLRSLLLLLSLTLLGCYAEELESDLTTDPFFSLQDYFRAEIDRLEAQPPEVTKTVTLNGVTETQTRSDVAFANDLRVFREADINRPAWFDKYATEEEANRTIYLATDSSMTTRELIVEGPVDRPSRILIKRRTGNVLSDGTHHLTYLPGESYTIRTVQENRFGDDVDALVTVVFN